MILIMTRVAARAASLLRPYRTFFASPGVLPVALAAGRLMDRVGARPVLLASGVLYPAALLGIVLGPRLGLGRTGTQALCAVAGLTVPQLTTVTMSLWARLLPEEEARQAAYSTESVVTEVVFILGPL